LWQLGLSDGGASGVPTPARIYDLRSTFASDALAAGVGIHALARVTGKSTTRIERHYGTLLDGAMESIAGRLDALDAERDLKGNEESRLIPVHGARVAPFRRKPGVVAPAFVESERRVALCVMAVRNRLRVRLSLCSGRVSRVVEGHRRRNLRRVEVDAGVPHPQWITHGI
jgi:hypothetical protein